MPNDLKKTQERPFDVHASLKESKLWGDIQRLGKTDPGMKDLLDQAVVYYLLKKGK